jgi:flagellar L-ring protein precursor FlgH
MTFHPTHSTQFAHGLSLLLAGLVVTTFGLMTPTAQAESLFRASASYSADTPFTPRSLFTQPRPANVGDLVTVLVDETSTQNATLQFRVTKSHTFNENGSSIFNNAVRFFAGKVPFIKNPTLVKDVVPSFNGLENEQNIATQVQSNKINRVVESVSCQVVQVLPNGNLVIQGKKVVNYSKELTDLYLTGIVNPYYIDKTNSIKSKQVGNMQFVMGGKGVISRQQNDGVMNKMYQYLY